MSTFRYRALTANGDVVSGSISATTAAEVAERVEYLGLIPIETVREEAGSGGISWDFSVFSRPRPEDVTIFTGDLALLLQTGARINDALELLSADADIGRLRPTVSKLTAAILSGESFADALARHPALFPPMYVELVRVGETSGTLVGILEMLGAERVRADALRRRFTDALRYPAFVLAAASAVLLFFLSFVLPQFGAVLRDFNTKLDPVLVFFLGLSEMMQGHLAVLGAGLVVLIGGGWLLLRRPAVRGTIMGALGTAAVHRPDLGVPSHQCLLPQPRCAARERRSAGDDVADPGGSYGHDRALRRLERHRGSRPSRGQTFRCADEDQGDPAHGGADAAAWRGFGSIADACATDRGVLRSQTPTQPRQTCWNCRSRCHHRDQYHCRRPDRLGHDRAYVSEPSRRMKPDNRKQSV